MPSFRRGPDGQENPDWPEVAQAIEDESDPEKILQLVQHLCEQLERTQLHADQAVRAAHHVAEETRRRINRSRGLH